MPLSYLILFIFFIHYTSFHTISTLIYTKHQPFFYLLINSFLTFSKTFSYFYFVTIFHVKMFFHFDSINLQPFLYSLLLVSIFIFCVTFNDHPECRKRSLAIRTSEQHRRKTLFEISKAENTLSEYLPFVHRLNQSGFLNPLIFVYRLTSSSYRFYLSLLFNVMSCFFSLLFRITLLHYMQH